MKTDKIFFFNGGTYMLDMNSKIFTMLLATTLLFSLVGMSLSSVAYDETLHLIISSNQSETTADLPTWVINDSWTYEADIYSDTENGIFDVSSENLMLLVTNITTILHQNKTITVYNVSITGDLEGSFDTSDLSGDISGEINGYALIRQADLSLIHTNIVSDGVIQWLLITLDYEMDSIASYYPGFEYFDFPIQVNETWNTSSTVHQNSSMYVENFYDNQTESTSTMNGTVTCDTLSDITTPAGTFSSYHIISEGNGTIESYYNQSVKNMVKLFVNQSNETSTTIIDLDLKSYDLNTQSLQVTATLTPSVVNVGDSVEISGTIHNDTNQPMQDITVTITIPYTNHLFTTSTNESGSYSLTFTAPLFLDSTETTFDLASDGIQINSTDGNQQGYTLTTLTITGIAVESVQAIPAVEYETNPVNLTCTIHSVEPIIDHTVFISGPSGFTPINVTLQESVNQQFYFCQPYQIIGSYSFYVWAQNELGNTFQSNMHQFNILEDNIGPEIQDLHIHPNPQYLNDMVNISCTITDNVAVDQAQAVITNPLDLTTNISLTQNQNNYYYSSTYSIIGDYSVVIWTKDTLGNTNQSVSHSFSIILDTNPPVIDDCTLDVGYHNQSFTFNATITDDISVDTSWVEYWFDTENHTNESMNEIETDQWQKTITIPEYADTLFYYIASNDTSNNWNQTDQKTVLLTDYEQLDINQSNYDRGFPIRHAADGDWAGAQDFTPTLGMITSVDLWVRSFGTPEFDLVVELCEDGPEGTLVDTVIFTPGEVSGDWSWLPVDFSDITVSSGTDYFIVVPPAPSGVTSSFGYEWGYAFGDQYPDGSFWFTRDGGGLWRDLPDSYEFTFRVFGNDSW